MGAGQCGQRRDYFAVTLNLRMGKKTRAGKNSKTSRNCALRNGAAVAVSGSGTKVPPPVQEVTGSNLGWASLSVWALFIVQSVTVLVGYSNEVKL